MDSNFFKNVRILDGGMGQLLLEKGLVTMGTLWSASALLDEKYHQLLIDTHLSYINAGADVITANTYASTPISMKKYGYDDLITKCNYESVKIAKEAAEGKNVSVAGSVSTYGYFYKDGTEKMKPSFNEHLKILTDSGVDLIILEAMSSQADIVEALVECSNQINLPIWLSISCVFDKNKKINLGYDDDINKDKPKIYENLEES